MDFFWISYVRNVAKKKTNKKTAVKLKYDLQHPVFDKSGMEYFQKIALPFLNS